MKRLLTLSLLIFKGLTLLCQPANDDCSGVVHLGEAPICPVPGAFTNVGATTSIAFSSAALNIPDCFVGGVVNRDVWFAFDVPASGNLVDFTLEITGVGGMNGSIKQPQVAVYRGDCELDGLEILDCAAAGANSSQLVIDLLGLTPGLTYFLRIADWSASASSNAGDFELCLKEYDPVFNMGEAPGSEACAGTLFDSGGENGNYSNSENKTFVICPSEFHQCIHVNVVNLQTEQSLDYLRFFAGASVAAPSIGNLDGFASNVQLQVSSTCLTVQFTSDNSVPDAGFELTWQCSPDTCTVQSPTTCADPVLIGSLPYSADDLTTCFSGNEFTLGPCNDDDFLATEDFVFAYQSPGNECVAISVTGSENQTGVGIYNACPNSPAADCIAQAGGGFFQNDPAISAAFLETPGTYYIVVDNADECTPFNIEVKSVACPVVLPSAAYCEDALSLNGCGELPAIVSVAAGEGDPDFINFFFNLGCWDPFFPYNYTFFYFQAQADGEFGFVMESADPDEASDIDFQVWGPVSNFNSLCNYAKQNQPVRSSYGAGNMATGMANVHPLSGLAVNDVCEDADGDDFVKTLDVQSGQYYLVLINDFDQLIVSGAISIDFAPTTPGVLGAPVSNFTVSPDAVVCPGEVTQLVASGAETYAWFPAAGLSCVYCPNPVASPSQTTTYSVVMHSVCHADTLQVEVALLNLEAGDDRTVCLGEQFQVVAGGDFGGVNYSWTAPPGFLSCTDCPNPTVTGATAGTFNIGVTATGSGCNLSDAFTLTVLPQPAPVFTASDDLAICLGSTVSLGGATTPGVNYTWTSDPPGFVSGEANPVVTPSQTTTYFLQATNAACPFPGLDTVFVGVDSLPQNLSISPADTLICAGDEVSLTSPVFDLLSFPEITFQWSPPDGLLLPDESYVMAVKPAQTTVYQRITTNGFCSDTASATVNVLSVSSVEIAPAQSQICPGGTVQLTASAPVPVQFSWQPAASLSCNDCPNPVATPSETTTYVVSGNYQGCPVGGSATVEVVPAPSVLFPLNVVVCPGESLPLNAAPNNAWNYQWAATDPNFVSLSPSPDATPLETTTYYVTVSNGICPPVQDSVTIYVADGDLQVSSDTSLCGNQSVELFAQGSVPGHYSWQPGGVASQNFTPDLQPGVNLVQVTFSDSAGCFTLTDTVLVELLPGIEILEIQKDKADSVFAGTPVILTVVTSMEAAGILWSSGGTLDTAQVLALTPPSETYAVTVTDGQGCTDTASISITVLLPQFDIPNIFTPNGDGVNDSFKVVVTGDNIQVLSMQIFNRWGQEVFSSTGGNDGWDGRQDGEDAPSDVYVFIVEIQEATGERVVRKGDLTLAR